MRMNISQALIESIPGLDVATDTSTLETYGRDWTTLWPSNPSVVVWPRDVAQVQAVMRFANENGVAVVPSGGRTGLSGGAVAMNGEIVLSLEKLNKILSFNRVERTAMVQAGAVLQTVQEYAAERGLQFPIDLGARGSCTIGGNIATNAGGIRVLKYGNTREWVAGVTVVTAQGELIEFNRGLVKNSSGYDMRHLMVGSEGTLGVIVEAELKFTDPLPESQVMLIGLPDFESVVTAFVELRQHLKLQAFEFFTDLALRHVISHGAADPFDAQYPYYVVAEFDQDDDAAMAAFEQGMENGWIVDGALSASNEHKRKFWHLRESITESIAPRKPYKNDIAIRISRLPEFLQDAQALFDRNYPDFEVIWFGHIGDGNLHISILQPESMGIADFASHCSNATKELAYVIQRHGGSISAEHGIGLLKRDYLSSTRSDSEIALMRATKAALDPAHILNPGKIFV